ncbi:hypothetical protein EDD17DRAFT_1453841, partial [Pisolithus thermaeus]
RLPTLVTHTYAPRLGIEPLPSKAEAATSCASNIQSVIESTKHTLQQTTKRMMQQAESSCLEAPVYRVGNEVWIEMTHIWIDCHPSQKLTEKWVGSYKV